MRPILLVLKLAVAAACIASGTLVRAPFMAGWRPWPLIGLVAVAALVVATSQGWRGWSARKRIERLDLLPFAVGAAALLVAIATEARFQHARWSVLTAQPQALEQLGRHIVVGYGNPGFVRELVERRAIGGIFLTRRNVIGRDAASVAREIAEFQAIRARQGLAPLWIATDQEGGGVSRLSPPLDQQPPLSAVHRGLDGESRRRAVTAYANQQGRGLAALGVNVNFAPVIDLDFGVRNPNDSYTRISDRAIAADPGVVADVAGWYCDALAAQGVRCTLKHFPGLGRVFEDTHHSEGVLDVPLGDLEMMDWVPFRRLLGRADSLVMVGHVRLTALDASQPVSTSRQAVAGLIRGAWRYDGLVITDDLCMGAVHSGRGGIGQAGVRALNAGVDLLLVSWDGEQVYPLLAALLQSRSELDAVALRQSLTRLQAAQATLPTAQQ
jgi:beta-N-acetylhexosaminidase